MSSNLGRSDPLCCFYYLLQVLLVCNSEARIPAVLSSEKSFCFFLGCEMFRLQTRSSSIQTTSHLKLVTFSTSSPLMINPRWRHGISFKQLTLLDVFFIVVFAA